MCAWHVAELIHDAVALHCSQDDVAAHHALLPALEPTSTEAVQAAAQAAWLRAANIAAWQRQPSKAGALGLSVAATQAPCLASVSCQSAWGALDLALQWPAGLPCSLPELRSAACMAAASVVQDVLELGPLQCTAAPECDGDSAAAAAALPPAPSPKYTATQRAAEAIGLRFAHSLTGSPGRLTATWRPSPAIQDGQCSAWTPAAAERIVAWPGLAAPPGTLVLPTSANPFHAGHEQLALAAASLLRSTGHAPLHLAFEVALYNADKAPIDASVALARIGQIAGPARVATPAGMPQLSGSLYPALLTQAALFMDKARLMPGCSFVIGIDTAVRLLDPKYYGGSEGLRQSLASLSDLGARFVVAARAAGASRPGTTTEQVHTLAAFQHLIPAGYEDLFLELPASSFLAHISSSAIRAAVPAAS